MVVKANQPDLYTARQEWFAEPAWDEEDEAQMQTSGKGRARALGATDADPPRLLRP